MNTSIDLVQILQIIALLIPTISLLMVFVRLGSLLQTIRSLTVDVHEMKDTVKAQSSLVTELKTWREASVAVQTDLIKRIGRLEDIYLKER